MTPFTPTHTHTSQHHQENISKQLLPEEKALFLIQNLVGEIVRLPKLMAAMKGVLLDPEIAEKIKNINQSTIAKAWGVTLTRTYYHGLRM